MKIKKWIPYGVGIGIAEGVGILSGLLSRQGMDQFNALSAKPPLTPPMWLFPVVWGILYALMGIGSVRIWRSEPSKARHQGLNLYVFQLVLNFFWSLIFFNVAAYGFAFLWLVVLWFAVLAMIWQFYKVDSVAAWLQVPYLIWLTFAAYLNLGVWLMNK